MLLGSARGYVALRYVILKFLRVNLSLCGHELRFFCLQLCTQVFFTNDKKKFLVGTDYILYGLQFLFTFH